MRTDRDTEQADRYAAGGSRSLQPVVSASDLAEFRDTTEAVRLVRLEADTELMLRLSVEGFGGRVWTEVSRALVEYGFTVMRAWVVTGQVFMKLREKGRSVADPPHGGIPRSDALVMAEDAVADAIVHFRDKVLKKGYWDPSKGASLTTFFIGNCLMFQFPNVYRSWRRDYVRVHRHDPIQFEDGDREHPALLWLAGNDPANDVVAADLSARRVQEILEPLQDGVNQSILMLRADGFGIDEIAEILGLAYDVVESRLYRARKKLREVRGA
jgi:DNA-directed RNA polymerase specialized sigma24 family protein